MNVTRINADNFEYFSNLFPEDSYEEDDYLYLGAISDEGDACSAARIGVFENIAYIDWIYTDPDHRELGAATSILDVVTTLLKGMPLDGIEIAFADDDEALEAFLTDYGFLVGEDSFIYRIPIEDIIYSSYMDRMDEHQVKNSMVEDLTGKRAREKVVDYLEAQGVDPGYYSDCHGEYSFARYDEAGNVIGCMLAKEDGEDLKIEYFSNSGPADGVVSLVCALRDAAVQNGIDDGYVTFTDGDGRSIEFVENFTGNDRDEYRIEGVMRGILLNID